MNQINQINKTNQINEMNQTDQITLSTSGLLLAGKSLRG
jgi:hypothetical protein